MSKKTPLQEFYGFLKKDSHLISKDINRKYKDLLQKEKEERSSFVKVDSDRIRNAEEIRQFIIDVLNVDVFKDIKKRDRKTTEARALFYKIASVTNVNYTLKSIGDLFGKTHATIINSIKLYDSWLYKDFDVYLNTFKDTHGTTLHLSKKKRMLLKTLTSKMLEINDETKLDYFKSEVNDLMIKY